MLPSLPSLDAWELRRLAESAHGTRGVDLHLVVRAGKYAVVGAQNVGDVFVATLCTAAKCPTTVPSGFSVSVAGFSFPARLGVVNGDVTTALDAFFWTESSIEKFFFPYYAGVLDKDEFDLLRSSYYKPMAGKSIFAFGHEPGTRWVPETSTAAPLGAIVLYVQDNVIYQESLGDWLAFLATQ